MDVHGTRRMYRERSCRCDLCRGWNAEQKRRYDQGVKAREGRSVTQKYRPGKTRYTERPCSSCGVVIYGGLQSPTCSKCRARDKRGIQIKPAARLAIYDRDGWTCGFCSGAVDPALSGRDLYGPTLDHIIPRSKGGSDEQDNLRLVHRYCNSIRRDSDALTLDELAA